MGSIGKVFRKYMWECKIGLERFVESNSYQEFVRTIVKRSKGKRILMRLGEKTLKKKEDYQHLESKYESMITEITGLQKVIQEVQDRTAFKEDANQFLKMSIKEMGSELHKLQEVQRQFNKEVIERASNRSMFREYLRKIEWDLRQREVLASKQSELNLQLTRLTNTKSQFQFKLAETSNLINGNSQHRERILSSLDEVIKQVKIIEIKCFNQAYFLYILREQFWILKKVKDRQYVYNTVHTKDKLFNTSIFDTLEQNMMADLVFFMISMTTKGIQKILKKHSSFNPELKAIYPLQILQSCKQYTDQIKTPAQFSQCQNPPYCTFQIFFPESTLPVLLRSLQILLKYSKNLKSYCFSGDAIHLDSTLGTICILLNAKQPHNSKSLRLTAINFGP